MYLDHLCLCNYFRLLFILFLGGGLVKSRIDLVTSLVKARVPIVDTVIPANPAKSDEIVNMLWWIE